MKIGKCGKERKWKKGRRSNVKCTTTQYLDVGCYKIYNIKSFPVNYLIIVILLALQCNK